MAGCQELVLRVGDAGWLSTYAPAPDAVVARLGGSAVWFSGRGQAMHALNDTAAFIWTELSTGSSPEAAARGLVARGADAGDAEAFVAELLSRWTASGDLCPVEALQDRVARVAMDLRLAGLHVRLELDRALPADAFAAAFGHLRAAGEPVVVLRLVVHGEITYAIGGGRCLGSARTEDAVALLKGLLTEALIETLEDGFAIHAACVGAPGGVWLLAGDPGAGKSTLCTALISHGFSYGGDDVALLRADGRVEGAPFAIALKEGAWELTRSFAPRVASLPVYRRPDGQRVRYLAPLGSESQGRARLAGVLFLDRQHRAAPRLERIDPVNALIALLKTGYSGRHALSSDEFTAAATALDDAPAYRLIYEDLPAAVALITGVAVHGAP